MDSMNAPSSAQLTMFIWKRSPFSNGGSSRMIALYFGLALRATALAASASQPNTSLNCLRNDPENSAHMPMGIPIYFMSSSPLRRA